MTTLLTVLFALGLAALFLRRPVWGIYALIATLPFERIGSWALNPVTAHPVVRLSQVVGAALILAFGGRVLARHERLRWPPWPLWLLGGFGLSAGVSAALTGHRSLLGGWVALMFVTGLVYVLYCLADQIRWPTLGHWLLASAGLVAAFGLYQFVAGSFGVSAAWTGLRPAYERQVFGFPRVQSTALEPLYFANYLLIPLLVGLVAGLSGAKWWRRQYWAVLAGMSLVFVLTMSRGAFLGLGAALLVGGGWLVWGRRLGGGQRVKLRRVSGKSLATGAAVVILLGLGLVGGASLVAGRGFSQGPAQFVELVTVKLTTTGSFTDRTQMRQTALGIFRTHPVWGVGVEGITPYLRGYPAVRSDNDIIALNNQFYEVLAETGVVGAGLFYGFLLSLVGAAVLAWRRAAAELRPWIMGLTLAIVAMTVQAQSFSGFLLTHLWVSYGLLAALAVLAPSAPKRDEHRKVKA